MDLLIYFTFFILLGRLKMGILHLKAFYSSTLTIHFTNNTSYTQISFNNSRIKFNHIFVYSIIYSFNGCFILDVLDIVGICFVYRFHISPILQTMLDPDSLTSYQKYQEFLLRFTLLIELFWVLYQKILLRTHSCRHKRRSRIC